MASIYISPKSEQHDILLDAVKQTAECAIFIGDYIGCGFSEYSHLSATDVWPDADNLINDLRLAFEKLARPLNTGVVAKHVFVPTETVKLDDVYAEPAFALFDTLNPCDASSPLQSPCSPGTRHDVLQTITNWITTPLERSNMLWLYGFAGSGKTTIITSLFEYLLGLNRLGAALFFDHWSRPHTVIPTIAYWLGRCNAHLELAIFDAIAANPGIVNAPIQTQYEKLLRVPLMDARHLMNARHRIRGPIVIILDGLDVCGDARSRQSLLYLLPKIFSDLPLSIRFLIASRSVPDIEETLSRTVGVTRICLDVAESTTMDVLCYITHRLRNISNNDPHWPGRERIQKLVALANGLFIWASTATEFISNAVDPNHRLETLLHHKPAGKFDLNELYSVVLANAGPWNDDVFSQDACAVLGTVVLAKMRLTDGEIDSLLKWEPGRSSGILKALSGILRWKWDVTQAHSSLGAYLMDHSHLPRRPWFIDSKKHNRILHLAYLRFLKDKLRFNICDLGNSHILNADVPRLSEDIEASITPLLANICRYWANGLHRGEFDSDVFAEVKEFFNTRFLYWLEVLSLLKQVWVASDVLTVIGEYIHGRDETFEIFVADALKFVEGFAPVIQKSVPHIYLSALPFCRRGSSVYKQYSPLFPQTLRCVSPFGAGSATAPTNAQPKFPGHRGQVVSLAFSPDGTEIASGSVDATVRLWDARTGEDLLGEPFKGHKDWVISVAFSPDSRHILSGSYDNTLGVWDTWPDQILVQRRFPTHMFVPQFTHCLAFSRDCKLVATGPKLCIWDTETRLLLFGPLDDLVVSISVSADAKRVVSGYTNGTVKVWCARTGECIAGPFSGHTARVSALAFSESGACIVSGSHDCTLRLWDTWTGDMDVVAVFDGHRDWVTSVAFSPDETRIVSGSRDNTICVWDAHTGCMVAGPLHGHSSYVNVVAFSPDGTRIASGSRDKTIRVWEMTRSFGSLEDDIRLEDGWMVTPSGARLFWVPPELREGLYFPRNSAVISSKGATKLDLRRFVHGNSWEHCKSTLT
ncbi:hypothetical protein FB451DRAFT_731708 [Mycena latifolia]|nr:hypothetical protein FB451DRAFT_731708 [Mycena latifolia]